MKVENVLEKRRMKATKFSSRHAKIHRFYWVFAGIGAIILGVLAGSAWAQSGGGPGSLRVVKDPAGGVAVEWMRNGEPSPLRGWHVDRQLPDGGRLRVTAEPVEPGIFDSPASVYRIHDASAPVQAGDSVSYRLVPVDPEFRERPAPFVPCVVEAAPEIPEPLLSWLSPTATGLAPDTRRHASAGRPAATRKLPLNS